jgi:hypothetical protein
MVKSILIELLKKFTPKEIREFGEFVRSPFFNKNEGDVKLFDYLRKQYPEFKKECVEKSYVYARIFPNADYNDGFMRTLMFNLCSLAENYLSYQRFRDNFYVDKKYLLYELNERKLSRLFKKNLKSVLKKLEEEPLKDAEYYYNLYNIEYENLYFLGRTNLDKIEKIVKNSDVENMFNHLNYFYLIHSMNHYTYFLNIMELYRFSFKTDVFKDIMKALKADSMLDIPVLHLSYNLLMLFLDEENESFFFCTKELLDKHEEEFHRLLLNNAYMNLKNYCKRMILKGKNSFLKELFELYKIDISKKTYAMQTDMSFRYYTDVVETALKLKEYTWAKEFVKDYKSSLTPEAKENTYLYSLALIEFALKNFERSLELLAKVKYNDVYHKMKYRSLLLMIYYELDFSDLLLSHLDSFNHFLLNDTLISEERKIHYSNFIKYIRHLSGLRCKNINQDLHVLKQKVMEDPELYNKEWVIEKIDELTDS